MGLFDNISNEIEQLFLEYTNIDLSNPTNAKIRYSIIKDINSLSGNEDGVTIFRNTGNVLRLIDGKLIKSKGRLGVFYKKAGLIITAYEMLKTGLYSGRQVRKVVGISHAPVTRLMKANPELKCICGTRLSDHRGWCTHRYNNSTKRQVTVNNLNRLRKKLPTLVA